MVAGHQRGDDFAFPQPRMGQAPRRQSPGPSRSAVALRDQVGSAPWDHANLRLSPVIGAS
jgi:hypothetical protein